MANDIQFYEVDGINKIPTSVQNGAIYFVRQNNNIASLFVDLNNSRYEVKTQIPEATKDNAGLMSASDKQKLIPIIIDKYDNRIDIDNNIEERFNFLQDITIKDEEILTKNRLQGVKVTIVEDQESSLALVPTPTDDGKFVMNLNLNLSGARGPQGPPGETGKDGIPGSQGPQGDPGKHSKVTVNSYNYEEDGGYPSVEVSNGDIRENGNYIETPLNFKFKNLKGPKGDKGNIGNFDFKFQTGEEADISSYIDRSEDGTETKIYTVTVPRGAKGDRGNFIISRTFNSEREMNEALKQNIDEDAQTGIPWETFVLLSLKSSSDEQNGYLYYRNSVGDLKYITDLIPIQPKFSVVNKVSTVAWDENGSSTISYPPIDPLVANSPLDLSAPQLSFTLPRGKPMDFGTHIGNITYTSGDDNTSPSVDITATNTIIDSDTRKQDLTFNFTNLGKIYETTVGTNNINEVGTPQVTVSPSIEDNKQKLHFNFGYLKGERGDTGSAPAINSNVKVSVTSGNPDDAPSGTAFWTTENDQKVLNLNLTNVKGEQGDLDDLNFFELSEGGNAISSISYRGGGDIVIHKDYVFATEDFAKNADNIENGTIKVKNGGTGLNTVPLNNLLLGNGTNNLKTVANAAGALWSNGTDAPHYGILPVTLGGTGKDSLTNNAILTGNGTGTVKEIPTSFGAFFAENSNAEAQFGILPVSLGGTGSQFYQENSVLLGNGNQSDNLNATNSAKGALYSTGNNEKPQFDILPIGVGGTGATTAADARVNLGATYTRLEENENIENDFILKMSNVVTDYIVP